MLPSSALAALLHVQRVCRCCHCTLMCPICLTFGMARRQGEKRERVFLCDRSIAHTKERKNVFLCLLVCLSSFSSTFYLVSQHKKKCHKQFHRTLTHREALGPAGATSLLPSSKAKQSKRERERVTAGGRSGEVDMLALKGVCFQKLVVERVFHVSFLSSSANVPASTGAYHGFRAWTVILLGVLPQPLFREG